MIIAIDYDGTLKRSSGYDKDECNMWGNIIHAFRECEHDVIICTMRTGHFQDVCEVEGWMDRVGVDLSVVYCGNRGLKREVCLEEGHKVDIWIDDMPGMIEKAYILPTPEVPE